MTSRSRARRLASTLLLCALAAPVLADGEAVPAAAASPAARKRSPPPVVLVVPLGAGVLLPITLPSAMPHPRSTPASAAAQPAETKPEAPAARAAPARTEER